MHSAIIVYTLGIMRLVSGRVVFFGAVGVVLGLSTSAQARGSGACCDGGVCEIESASDCTSHGGMYGGDNTDCTSGNPCPMGSCCVGGAGGSCVVVTFDGCNMLGGDYAGDGTDCTSDPCPAVTGSCCIGGPGGTCTILTQADCATAGGEYAGDSTDCTSNPCPTAGTGSCCVGGAGGSCSIRAQADCATAGGSYAGDNTNCTNRPCPTGPTGACCVGGIGGACSVVSHADCDTMGGDYAGDFTDCTSDPCPPLAGACCDGGLCQIESASDCATHGGTYGGDNTGCSTGNPCPTGACCDGGVCQIEQQDRCGNNDGIYGGDGTNCANVTCTPVMGACCVGGAGGTCSVQTAAACANSGGSYGGNNTDCTNHPCPCSGGPDCNHNGIADSCDIAMGVSQDCNNNGLPDECESNLIPVISAQPVGHAVCAGASVTFSVTASGNPPPTYQWRKGGINIDGATSNTYTINPVAQGDTGSYDVVITNPCGSVTSNSVTLTVLSPVPASHYAMTTLCPSSTITSPNLFGFTDDGPVSSSCAGRRIFRLFSGRQNLASGKIWRVKQDCTAQAFGAVLCSPESVLMDVHARWPSLCSVPNLLIVGGCSTVYFVNPTNGTICEQYPDPTFGHIGQMALDSAGNLYVGSVSGSYLNVLSGGVVMPFYGPCGSPRAVAVDTNDNVYVTCATDGILRKIAADGTVINANFASGLTGAISQAIAPPGIFHGNLFVACNDRVMEVNLATGGAASLFLPCVGAAGIAFDPEGFLHVSVPTENLIHRIGSALPGDMNGDGSVTMGDLQGFVAALLLLPNAPLPIATADMNGDGCTNGLDIRPFMTAMGVP